MDWLDEIEACANAATPGPWEQRLNIPWNKRLGVEPNIAFCQEERDAAFIAPCRANVPRLIAEVRRLRDLAKPITGETSDGYHTFNELYLHRAVLFSVICNHRPDLAWKSKLHHDGTMYEDMFIVGIQTPGGQATYHYDIEPYWDMFKVKELPQAPEWDGHTPGDAIARIGALSAEVVRHGRWIMEVAPWGGASGEWRCSVCNTWTNVEGYAFCPSCGVRMDEKEVSK
ncbi:MAG: hypothetical protein PHS57_06210 [Alphaproteobacteria bacterium]|nr:hypothetical protein [Alphaproteobacteria bacterium]